MLERGAAVQALAAEEFDLVVVGGGLTGACAALDAARRGMQVAVVERRDFAVGASGRVCTILETAPDVAVDDARLTIAILSEAARHGAICANRLEATQVMEREHRIVGVRVHDHEHDGSFVIAAERVIEATGAWGGTGQLLRRTHLVLAARDVPLDGSGAVTLGGHAYALPWLGAVLVGPGDIDGLIGAVNASFGTTVERDDVVAAFTRVERAAPRVTVRQAVDRLADGAHAARVPDVSTAAYAARHEQARSVGDVLLRRTRWGLLAHPQDETALRVAQAMAPELGWSERRIRAEVIAWMREARAEGLLARGVKDSLKPPAYRRPS